MKTPVPDIGYGWSALQEFVETEYGVDYQQQLVEIMRAHFGDQASLHGTTDEDKYGFFIHMWDEHNKDDGKKFYYLDDFKEWFFAMRAVQRMGV
jgi:hypothetical protein